MAQPTLAVYASFVHQLVHTTCLDFVQIIFNDASTVLTFSLSAYYKYS